MRDDHVLAFAGAFQALQELIFRLDGVVRVHTAIITLADRDLQKGPQLIVRLYSTVTLFARLRGWSTSVPLAMAA